MKESDKGRIIRRGEGMRRD
jgi:hypothetical protein